MQYQTQGRAEETIESIQEILLGLRNGLHTWLAYAKHVTCSLYRELSASNCAGRKGYWVLAAPFLALYEDDTHVILLWYMGDTRVNIQRIKQDY